ncbi:MAG: 50S ribosomal protein L18 [Candidatus Micrarchaeota archaeon]
MAFKRTYQTQFSRRKKGQTNYAKRLALLKSKQNRVAIRNSNQGLTVECIAYQTDGDRVLAFAVARDIRKSGWKKSLSNIPAAYLTGILAGHRMKTAGVGNVVLDLGLQKAHHGGRLFAAAKGVIDAGIALNVNADVFPSDDRLHGKHIQGFAENVETVKQAILNSKVQKKGEH